MTRIEVGLTSASSMTHVPLACLGYVLWRGGVLDGLYDVPVPAKSVWHSSGDKLVEALVLILAGGRATYLADQLLRPNVALARAWGQAQFAQQSTLADLLDALDARSVDHLRGAFDALCADWSAAVHHDFRRGDLLLDNDLSGLRASRRAEGSERGYFAGEKTPPGANWRA